MRDARCRNVDSPLCLRSVLVSWEGGIGDRGCRLRLKSILNVEELIYW